MIVLDEQLQGLHLEIEIARWYHGRVCFVRSLRPGSVVKDDGIPHLLRSARQPTFVTEDWADFWQRVPAHRDF